MNNVVTSPPGAVRVWRGFQLTTLPLQKFLSTLGAVFIPATVKLQIDAGLHSYTPTVPAGLPGKPAYVPDETAILFWKTEQTYWNGFTRLAVRTYTLTHNGVYITTGTPLSRADFPVALTAKATMQPDAPVFLFNKEADWMNGTITHLVAERPRNVSFAKFQASVTAALKKIQTLKGLNGAIACIGQDYLVYWELGSKAPGTKTPVSGLPFLQPLLTGWQQVFTPAPTYLPIDIYDEWSGMNVCSGSSFNMQFERNPNVQ